MDLSSIQKNQKNLYRLNEIANVLAKHGFTSILEKIGLSAAISLKRRISFNSNKESDPQRVRMILEELGPTFVKLGQLLSTRQDIIGPAMAEELSSLQDNVPEFEFYKAKEIIETDLHKPLNQLFKNFNSKPIASASIGQVYVATLKNNRKVVVKVKRPDIEAKIQEDISLMKYFAQLMQKYVVESRPYGPLNVVEEFERSIYKEMNYLLEAKNAKHFAVNFANDSNIIIPQVHDDFCSERVITLDYIDGIKLKDLSNHSGFDKKILAHRFASAFFKMALIDGFYHADPHPANVLAVKPNKICFLDFGMVGHLDPIVTEQLSTLFLAIMQNNVDSMIVEMEELSIISGYPDTASLRRDLTDLMDEYYDTKIQNLRVGQFIEKLTNLTSRHGAKLPRDYVLLFRGISLVESNCRKLDPNFNSVEAFRPLVSTVMKKDQNPLKFLRKMPSFFFELNRMSRVFPNSVGKIFNRLESGKFEVEFEHKDMNLFTGEMERTSNKISMALILSALIIGSAMIIMSDRGATIFGLPILGFLGFVISGAIALWLILTIMKYKQV